MICQTANHPRQTFRFVGAVVTLIIDAARNELGRAVLAQVATIGQEQQTVNRLGKEVTFIARGRHDPCVVPRAVPVVEAMAGMLVLDMMLEAGKIPYRV